MRYKRIVGRDTTWYVGDVEIAELGGGNRAYTRHIDGYAIVLGKKAANGSGFGTKLATGSPAHIGSHALAGGVLDEIRGGNFGHGFVSAGITRSLNFNRYGTASTSDAVVRFAAAAVVGGTLFGLTDGKFANGAYTAGFAQLYNGERNRPTRVQEVQR